MSEANSGLFYFMLLQNHQLLDGRFHIVNFRFPHPGPSLLKCFDSEVRPFGDDINQYFPLFLVLGLRF